MMEHLVSIIVGFAGGFIAGGGVVAFFTVLGVVTRLVNLGKTKKYIRWYEFGITAGAVFASLIYFLDIKLSSGKYTLIFIGLSMGIFIGMVASALAEMLDVIPVTARRLGIVRWLYVIILAVILGKMAGSAVYWVIPGFY